MSSKTTKGVALITGAASGIGKNTTFSFAESGATAIIFADFNEKGVQEAAEMSKKYTTNKEYQCVSVHVDVTDPSSVQAMVDTTLEKFGRIDYFVNSAGVGSDSSNMVADVSLGEFDKIININLKGTLLCNRAVSKAMISQESVVFEGHYGPREIGRGSIVNLGSVNSLGAQPGKVPYTTAKHGVIAITKTAAMEGGPHGIRVNVVCPSWVDTPMVDRQRERNPQLDGMIKAIVPGGRIAEPDEIGDAIVFLCSPAASYISGTVVVIDNGTSLSVRLN
ncbi:NAD(P)-binding protein [Glonium stellatum]|uniref:NAD(P)-binding protein n=1 Tax=Glonium stellatum TaxID=574774 RepID=A0A8E2F3Q3_9PEZI|nr:NAD(P)-binding protein [Glonium stellatum]